MGLSITILKDKDRDKLLDGSGIALEAITLDPTTRTGADQEIVHHPDHVSPLKMITPWICLLSFAKPQTTKNAKNTKRLADASSAENKAISFMTAPIKRHALVLLTPFKSKMTTN